MEKPLRGAAQRPRARARAHAPARTRPRAHAPARTRSRARARARTCARAQAREGTRHGAFDLGATSGTSDTSDTSDTSAALAPAALALIPVFMSGKYLGVGRVEALDMDARLLAIRAPLTGVERPGVVRARRALDGRQRGANGRVGRNARAKLAAQGVEGAGRRFAGAGRGAGRAFRPLPLE